MPSSTLDSATALVQIKAIYDEVDRRPIQHSCIQRTECCQFRLTGKTPMLTRGEALMAAKGVRAVGWKELPEMKDGVCPLLASNGKCRIYAERPFGCRTHFCSAAGGPYPRNQVLDLIRRLEQIDAALGGCGPRVLESAVSDELAKWSTKKR